MSLLREISRDLGDLVARAAPAVAGLRHRRGQGSGVVVTPDGYVVTNSHVARAEGPLQVRLPGRGDAMGRLVGADDRTDLAVVRVDASGLATLALPDAVTVRVGELVVAIGNPLGLERSVSLGVVSALHRDLPTRDGVLEGLLQTDASVNPGNSGGPLLDADGAVAGITTAMLPFARGIGFAIPSRTASWVASVLIQHGEVRRPYLGIAARAEELGEGTGRGVRVLRVEPGTPAATAGLRGQDVLLSANGQDLRALDDLQRVMVLAAPAEIHLDVLRSGERRLVAIRPAPAVQAA
jgi:S1-C subfamily serine protease